MTDEVIMARTGLLDALEALQSHLDALVIVGAQAIYLHTGSIQVALAEFTTDGDVAIDPDALSSALSRSAPRRSLGFAVVASCWAELSEDMSERTQTVPNETRNETTKVAPGTCARRPAHLTAELLDQAYARAEKQKTPDHCSGNDVPPSAAEPKRFLNAMLGCSGKAQVSLSAEPTASLNGGRRWRPMMRRRATRWHAMSLPRCARVCRRRGRWPRPSSLDEDRCARTWRSKSMPRMEALPDWSLSSSRFWNAATCHGQLSKHEA